MIWSALWISDSDSPLSVHPAMIPSSCELLTPEGVRTVSFRLRRSRRNRYLRVSVRDTGDVLLSVPSHVSDSGALDFLRSQSLWLIQTLGKLPRHTDIVEHLQSEPWLSLDGRRARVVLDKSRMRMYWEDDPERGDAVIDCVTSRNPDRQEIVKALSEMARTYVPGRVEVLADKVGVRFKRVTIRDQRTIWGSCTSRGNLSFNWRVILLPSKLHDHIILHELAHLTHMDHSSRFYSLLNRYDPDSFVNDNCISKLSPVFMALGRH